MMNHTRVALMAALTLLGLQSQANAQLLGTAQSFAVLAGSEVTNTGPTDVTGNVGVWPGLAITGFPPGIVTDGVFHTGNAVAQQAQADLTTAYNTIAIQPFDTDLTGQDLGGLTLFPGVYRFSSSAFLTGTLTLNALGDANARFDFQIGSTLISASNASVVMINSAQGANTYWQVGSSATLGTNTAFTGHILALSSITLNTGATILDGSALARNGAVTMDTNTITLPQASVSSAAPEPGTLALLGAGIGIAGLVLRRRIR